MSDTSFYKIKKDWQKIEEYEAAMLLYTRHAGPLNQLSVKD